LLSREERVATHSDPQKERGKENRSEREESGSEREVSRSESEVSWGFNPVLVVHCSPV
jgi:hypothetical protein